jgi:hypothetical protein
MGDANQAKLPSQEKKGSCMSQFSSKQKQQKQTLSGKPTIFMNLLKVIELDVEVLIVAGVAFGLKVGELGQRSYISKG